jgi:hypothetical protein
LKQLSKRGGGTNNGSSWRIWGANREDLRLARRTAADIFGAFFAVPTETVSIPPVVEAGVQAEVRAETELEEEVEATVLLVEAEAEAKELTLEESIMMRTRYVYLRWMRRRILSRNSRRVYPPRAH